MEKRRKQYYHWPNIAQITDTAKQNPQNVQIFPKNLTKLHLRSVSAQDKHKNIDIQEYKFLYSDLYTLFFTHYILDCAFTGTKPIPYPLKTLYFTTSRPTFLHYLFLYVSTLQLSAKTPSHVRPCAGSPTTSPTSAVRLLSETA